MEYTLQYIKKKEYLIDINFVRQYKAVYIPIKLIGENEMKITDCYKNKDEPSIIM